jgi:hypothetical protein
MLPGDVLEFLHTVAFKADVTLNRLINIILIIELEKEKRARESAEKSANKSRDGKISKSKRVARSNKRS